MLPAQVSYWTLQETKRHNLATEDIAQKETDIKQFVAKENARHNLAFETETSRHNIIGEQLQGQQIALGWSQLAEIKRSNPVRERETNRSNVARETETKRSNLRNEDIQETGNVLNFIGSILGTAARFATHV